MTHAEKYDLYLAWREEISRDWRASLDDARRTYLDELDQMSEDQLSQEERREFDGLLQDIKAAINQDLVQKVKARPAEYSLAESLVFLRHELGMDQEALAARSGLFVEEIRAFESAKGNPSFATLNRIANATGYTIRMSFVRWFP